MIKPLRTIKQRKCRNPECKQKYTPVRPLQTACSIPCAIVMGKIASDKKEAKVKADAERAERLDVAKRKEALKSITEWADEVQVHCNKVRRLEDLLAGYGCISCGTHKAVQWHAGHYRTVKAAKQLRFNPKNINLQCSQCNSHDSGNIVEYRINLVKRIGAKEVEVLENNNEIRRYTVDELRGMKAMFSKRARELEKEIAWMQ